MLAPLLNLLLPLLVMAGFACFTVGLVFYFLSKNKKSEKFKSWAGKLLTIAACCLLPVIVIIVLVKTNSLRL